MLFLYYLICYSLNYSWLFDGYFLKIIWVIRRLFLIVCNLDGQWLVWLPVLVRASNGALLFYTTAATSAAALVSSAKAHTLGQVAKGVLVRAGPAGAWLSEQSSQRVQASLAGQCGVFFPLL